MRIKWTHIRIAFSVLAAITVLPVVGQFFVALADERGWYKHPSEKVAQAVVLMGDLVGAAWFHWTAGILIGLAVGVWLDTIFGRPKSRPENGEPDAPSPIEITFDPSDKKCVKKTGALYGDTGERYYIFIRNSGQRTLENVSIRALESWFTQIIIAVAQKGHSDSYRKPVMILEMDELHPDAPEKIELFGVSYLDPNSGSKDILCTVQRFTLEARAKDTKAVRITLEYDPRARPMLRCVT
jgi:hypothetical protein